MLTRAGASSRSASSSGAILAASVPTATLLCAVRPGTGVNEVGGAGVDTQPPARTLEAAGRLDHQPAPGEREQQRDLGAQCLRPAPQLPQRAPQEAVQDGR